LINAAVKKMQEAVNISDETAGFLAASAIRYFMIRFNLTRVIAMNG